jgi:hypothetical protein
MPTKEITLSESLANVQTAIEAAQIELSSLLKQQQPLEQPKDPKALLTYRRAESQRLSPLAAEVATVRDVMESLEIEKRNIQADIAVFEAEKREALTRDSVLKAIADIKALAPELEAAKAQLLDVFGRMRAIVESNETAWLEYIKFFGGTNYGDRSSELLRVEELKLPEIIEQPTPKNHGDCGVLLAAKSINPLGHEVEIAIDYAGIAKRERLRAFGNSQIAAGRI